MLTLRRANINDKQQYFEWKNDEVVRQNALNSEIVDWETHKKWFNKKLKDRSSFLYVAHNMNHVIGQVRFDCCNGKATISYSVSNNFRKRGFGYKMVQQAINKINEDFPSTKMIEAKVKESNIASNKIFLGLNFYEQGRVGQVVIYQLKLT